MKRVLVSLLALWSGVVYAAVTIPYTFTPNGSVSSSQVNADFSAVASEINSHEAASNPHNTTLSTILTTGNSCGSTPINFNGNQAIDMLVENLGADPTPGNQGRVFINTSTHLLKFDDGSTIQTVGGSGSNNLSSVLNSGNSAGAFNLDMNHNQVLNLRVENRTSDPSSEAGRLYYRTDNSTLNVCSSGACTALGGAQSLSSVLGVGNTVGSSNINFNGHQASNLVLDSLASDPGSPTAGQLWYNTTSHIPKFYNGSSALAVGNTNTLAQTIALGASTGAASIDFGGGQAQHMVVWNNAGSPGTGTGGYLWYDTGTGSLNYETSGANHRVCSLDGTETLTNKTIDGGSNTLTNIADGSLSSNVVLKSGSQTVTGTKTFSAAPVISYIKTPAGGVNGNQIPDGVGDDTFVLANATQTLAGKTLTAPAFTSNTNFNEGQAAHFRVENLASNPTVGNAGRLFFKTSTGELLVDDGTNWKSISVNGGAVSGSSFDIVGTADVVDLTVQGFSTQTHHLVEFLDSTSTPLFTLDNSGNGRFSGTVTTNSLGSGSANPATVGAIRLASGDTIDWRNNANSGNVPLGKDASDQMSWNGTSFLGSTGTLLAAGFPALTGDVTTSAGSLTTAVSKIAGVTVTGTTGTVNSVFSNSPVLVTPNLGTPSTLVGTNITGTGASFTAGNATNAATATNATNVTTTATNTTNASFFPLFVGSSSSGNQGADTSTGLTWNPSSNTLATTTFSGALSGNSTTATALAATPTACGSNVYATSIASNGNLSCSSITNASTTATSAPTASTIALRDANSNTQGNAFTRNYTTTVTSGGTKTLVVGSSRIQYLTGSSAHTLALPAANTLSQTGDQFEVHNNSTGIVTVTDNGANTLYSIPGCPSAPCPATLFTVTNIGSANGTWDTATGGGVTQLTTKGDALVYSTSPVRHAVPADYGNMIADQNQTDGWRNRTYTQLDGKPGKNYIQYSDFENNATTGWTAMGCATLSAGIPTCVGSGGAALSSSNGGRAKNTNTAAPAIDNTSAIAGTYALNLATTGLGAAGDGYVSSAYTIDPADRGKPLAYRISYKVASGTPVQGGTSSDTYAVAAYDPANNAFLGNANPFGITQSSGVGTAQGLVQTLTTTTSIQFFLYSPVAPAGVSSLLVDDAAFLTSILPVGPPMTTPTAYTPTFTGMGTVANVNFLYWQEGAQGCVRGTFTTGTTTATEARISLPSGWTTPATLPTLSLLAPFGEASSASTLFSNYLTIEPSVTYMTVSEQSNTTNALTKQNGSAALVSTTNQSVPQVCFPIAGFTSGVTMDSSVRNAPTQQVFTSGSAQTYTTPAGVKWLEVFMWGGGGGGGGSGTTSGTAGGNGASSTFAGLLTAPGGSTGARGVAGGAGGAAPTITSPAIDLGSNVGHDGGPGASNGAVTTSGLPGGSGGGVATGGAASGAGGAATATGTAAATNSGGGGGGASCNDVSSCQSGSGGGGGAFVHAMIPNPSASYIFTVGVQDATHGQGQLLGTSGAAGAAAASGKIIVIEHYLNAGTVASTGAIAGTATNDNAPSGFVGEYASSNPGGTVSIGSNNAWKTVTSFTLTPGDWDVSGACDFTLGTATSVVEVGCAISTSTNASDSSNNGGWVDNGNSVSNNTMISTGSRRISIASSTTVYLVGLVAFGSAGSATWNTDSIIRARRMR